MEGNGSFGCCCLTVSPGRVKGELHYHEIVVHQLFQVYNGLNPCFATYIVP
jgi:hypothetical protein